MQFRHEVKHEISHHDMLILRQRLRAVMKPDHHAVDGKYEIRSLYFDNLDDKALREKLDGVNVREKYRIRLYDQDSSKIRLERKFKQRGLGYKDYANLTMEQAQAIVDGNVEWMSKSTDEVILGFYTRIRNEGLKPKVIVDYIREPFIFGPGNVRVTLDYGIRTSLSCTDFLNPSCITIPVMDSPCILEVKWDNYLPDVIRDAVQILYMVLSIVLLAIGISVFMKADLLITPSEGLVAAISQRFGVAFHNAKTGNDVTLVIIAMVVSFLYFGEIRGVREGTLISALFLGQTIKVWKSLTDDKLTKFLES